MLFYWNFYFLIGLTALLSHATAQSYGACQTPNNEAGTCTPLPQCTHIYKKLESATLTPTERDYLRRSQCGYENNQVLICCSNRLESPGDSPRVSTTNLLPQPPQCGTYLTDRIIGGNVTNLYEYPWMAMLEYTKPGNEKGHHCGGSLINDRYVLTAAHCVTGGVPSDWRLTAVRLGEWDTTTNPDCQTFRNNRKDCAQPHRDVAVEEIIAHPQYAANSRSQYNDIALLRLRSKVTFTKSIEPICLPIMSQLRSSVFANRKVDVAGWGQTENSNTSTRKLKVTLDVADHATCKRTYTRQNIALQATQMCAGGVSGIDSCRGDSGGPLIIEELVNSNYYYFLAGVVSFGTTPCALNGWPGVYTRVGAYIDWIQNTIRP